MVSIAAIPASRMETRTLKSGTRVIKYMTGDKLVEKTAVKPNGKYTTVSFNNEEKPVIAYGNMPNKDGFVAMYKKAGQWAQTAFKK